MNSRIRIFTCLAVLLLCAVSAASERFLEVTATVNMRREPENSATKVGDIPKGAVVQLTQEQGSWYKVQYNGKAGWIFKKYAVPARARAGDIFTKQDASMLPPVHVDEEKAEEQGPRTRYAQILQDNTLIREYLDPKAPFLYKARRGEVFELAGEGASWCMVVYGDTTGWVDCAQIKIHDTRPTGSAIIVQEGKTVAVVIFICVAAILIISGVIMFRHIRDERKRNIYVQKNALILAKESKPVQYMLTNSEMPMERCFTEIGFNVSVVKDSVSARNAIENEKTDIILVDWNFEPAIFTKIDNLFARMEDPSSAPYFLFYNVSDPASVPPAKVLKNVSFLGLTVSDRDIFKVVTPLIVHKEEELTKNVQKNLQHCALEGEIDGGNLLEVLQFIEIGSKTGCLMVKTKGPFGLVYFRDGMIVFAAAAEGQGVEAVHAILNQPSGKFRFITNKQPKVANLCLPVLSVLMEWTKEKDEANRG